MKSLHENREEEQRGGGCEAARRWRDAALRSRKLRSDLRALTLGATDKHVELAERAADVEVLNVGNNALHELPHALGATLSNLRVLVLRRNKFSSIPRAVLELRRLVELDVSHNCLRSVPEGVGQLGGLKKLCVSHNKIQQLPAQMCALQQLEELDVSFNELRALPGGVACLRRLRALDADHNKLGRFPAELLGLAELEELDLSGNELQALPDDLQRLRAVKMAWLSGVQLGALPASFCLLRRLESAMLDGNRLRGLPEGFGLLQGLKMVNLSSNELSEFPPALLAIAGLEELYLSRNKLSHVPAELHRLGRLVNLWLDHNSITHLPDSIVELQQLEELVLQGNHIAVLPDHFGKLSKVNIWKVKDNPLVQPPYEVCLRGIPSIAAYQKELALSQPAAKPRLKLVLMGAQGAGKTRLRRSLVEEGGGDKDGGGGVGRGGGRVRGGGGDKDGGGGVGRGGGGRGDKDGGGGVGRGGGGRGDKDGGVGRGGGRVRGGGGNKDGGGGVGRGGGGRGDKDGGSGEKDEGEGGERGGDKDGEGEKEGGGGEVRRRRGEGGENRGEKDGGREKGQVRGGGENRGGGHKDGGGESVAAATDCDGGGGGIEVCDWLADAERRLCFLLYELPGGRSLEAVLPLFLSPGGLYLLVVDLQAYSPPAFYAHVGRFLHLLAAKVPHAVVGVVGTHADLLGGAEVEEKSLDIHRQIGLQRRSDAALLRAEELQVEQALQQSYAQRCRSPRGRFYAVSDRNLRRRKSQLHFLLHHALQVLSPVLSVGCGGGGVGVARLREKLLSVAEHRDIFPNLHRVLPKSWQLLEELHVKPAQLWLSWWDSARLGLQAGLTEDRLQSALCYLHQSGKLLYFEDSGALREYVFHNLPRLTAILNVLLQQDEAALLRRLQREGEAAAEEEKGEAVRLPQLQLLLQGFLRRGLLPSCVLRLLLRPLLTAQRDLQLVMELLEKMGVCYCTNRPRGKPPNGAAAWYKFPGRVSSEEGEAEACGGAGALPLCPFFSVEQLHICYSFPLLFPPGLFARFSVQINSLVVQRTDGRRRILAWRGKVPVVVTHRPRGGAQQADTLSVASHASLPNIWTAWQAVTPLLDELNALLQEWPGLLYSVHILCPKCLKRGEASPHSFPGELLTQPRPEGQTEVICPQSSERVSVALLYPPTPTVVSPCLK